MRSARRNIWSTSWETNSTVVPCLGRLAARSSTWAVSATPEGGGRLVQDEQLGAVPHGPGHRHQLPLPARQVPDQGRGVRQGDARAGPGRRRRRCGGGSPRTSSAATPAEQQIGGHVQVVAERQVLPHHGHAFPPATSTSGQPPGGRRNLTDPLFGAMSPARQRTSVDLPAPFSPARATTSPRRTSRSTRSSARSVPNWTETPRADSSGCSSGVGGRRSEVAAGLTISGVAAVAARAARPRRPFGGREAIRMPIGVIVACAWPDAAGRPEFHGFGPA